MEFIGRQHRRPDHCSLCKRRMPLTFHHLIPRKLHRRSFFRKRYSKLQLNSGIYLCRSCHSAIHKLYSEMELAKELNTLERLQADNAIAQHVRWVSKQRVNYSKS